ncbi:mitochondrial ribosomal protein, L14 [Cichlidogyrus casuarinus]|uniref:Small ribosomal subunit protein mS40 n=1 Tax=Cichlidogyrus casuarinus TaxID=1844966 RepID=A0ABD2QB37_9PLAT
MLRIAQLVGSASIRKYKSIQQLPVIIPINLCSTKVEGAKVSSKNNAPVLPSHQKEENSRKYFRDKPYEPVDLETSLQYMTSDAFEQVYGNLPVWYHFRRNFKGHYQPNKTRKSCVVMGKIQTANPCPICRDDHLVLDYRNRDLLMHFINSVTLEVHPTSKTGLCIRQHKKLLLEYIKAVDLGTIPTRLPFVLYDYEDYYELNEDLKQLEGYKAYAELESKSDLNSKEFDSSVTSKLPPNLSLLLQENKMSTIRVLLQSSRNFWSSAQRTGPLGYIAPQTRLRVVDNSQYSHITNPTIKTDPSKHKAIDDILKEGTRAASRKLALCIRVYNKRNRGIIGDKVIVAVDGEKKRGYIVSAKMHSANGWPRCDSNDIVLIDDEGNPLGTRILVPIAAKLRSLTDPGLKKALSIATHYV